MISKSNFWHGKRVLLTGHTGFKGGWLAIWLQRLGAEVTGISLAPVSPSNLFDHAQVAVGMNSHFCDIRDAAGIKKIMSICRPEIVLHLAAQSLVRTSYRDPLTTYSTNVMGTANVLDAIRDLDSTRVAIVITTDKVYRNIEWHYPYRESDTLGGHDPYSASKAASEFVVDSFRNAYLANQGVSIASARAGNVIGGGDWSEDRLIPDAVRAWQNAIPLEIRRPEAIRPWQHVLEPLAGYLGLAQILWQRPDLAGAYNFGPQTHEASTVRTVIEHARKAYGRGEVQYSDGTSGPHEAGWLALETSKARHILGFTPQWGLVETIQRTMNWYRAHSEGAAARALCAAEITAYEAMLLPECIEVNL